MIGYILVYVRKYFVLFIMPNANLKGVLVAKTNPRTATVRHFRTATLPYCKA